MLEGLKKVKETKIFQYIFGLKNNNTKSNMNPKHEDDVYDFLPSALEVIEKPPTPFSRAILLLIISFLTVLIIWMVFAKMNIVISAQGKIIPTGKVKHIQPLESSIVKKIHVADGQFVKKGDILIELDSTTTTADKEATENEMNSLKIEISRLNAELKSDPKLFVNTFGADGNTFNLNKMLLDSSIRENEQRIKVLEQEIESSGAAYSVIKTEISNLKKTIPIAKSIFKKKEKLAKQGVIPQIDYMQAKMELMNKEMDLKTKKQKLVESEAQLMKAIKSLEFSKDEHRKELLQKLATANMKFDNIKQGLIKASSKQLQQRLRAPIDGIVHNLAVNTIGGVVTAAQVLMAIVPLDEKYEVEAKVLNKDVGYIELGKKVNVKVEAYEYTRYGSLDGVIEWVGKDSIADQSLGFVYPVRISINKVELPNKVNGRIGKITPGMSVTADMMVGERRVIEYFLGPIMRYKDESLRER